MGLAQAIKWEIFAVMYRRNVMSGECHVTEMTQSLVGDGWRWLAMVGNGWQWTPTIVGKVRRFEEVYTASVALIGNTSCFTRKTTSHPAHTSNLGKVGTVSYICHEIQTMLKFQEIKLCINGENCGPKMIK